MMFHEISPAEFDKSAFKVIGEDWMLVLAGDADKANAMTASWGGMGVLWGKDVVYVVIRPQRYTKEFVDANEGFSLAFLSDKYKEEKTYFGTVSGRKEDKIGKSGFTVKMDGDVPYFEEADAVFICRKLYSQPLEEDCFIDKSIIGDWYDGDLHVLYIAEVQKLLVKDV